jgi:hypothetical protein
MGCVTKSHLSWKTRTENQADRIIHNTTNRGERSGQARLTTVDVLAIRAFAGLMTQVKVAERFHITSQHVGQIVHRKKWRHI